jgi:hypothetical protein
VSPWRSREVLCAARAVVPGSEAIGQHESCIGLPTVAGPAAALTDERLLFELTVRSKRQYHRKPFARAALVLTAGITGYEA